MKDKDWRNNPETKAILNNILTHFGLPTSDPKEWGKAAVTTFLDNFARCELEYEDEGNTDAKYFG